MPLRRQVPNLQNLSLGNIANNVEFHARMFQGVPHKDEVFFRYREFQYLFGDILLKKLCRILFHERQPDIPLLDLVLSMHTEKVSVQSSQCYMNNVSEEITSHILFMCKAATHVDLRWSHVNDCDLLNAAVDWKNLVKLDLSSTNCTDSMICVVWDNCKNLKELFLFQSRNISDQFLFYLCKRNTNNEVSHLCQDNGFCCDLGKNLSVLNVGESRVTEAGIKVALLHVSSLERMDCFNPMSRRIAVSRVIVDLTDSITRNRRSFPTLRLKSIVFCPSLTSDEMQRVLSTCPHLEEVELEISVEALEELTKNNNGLINNIHMTVRNTQLLTSWEFGSFLLNWSTQLKNLCLEFDVISQNTISIQNIVKILIACKNLREFVIKDAELTLGHTTGASEIPGFIEQLLVFDVSQSILIEENAEVTLLEVIKRMRNLKTLHIPFDFVKTMCNSDTRKNFCSLETLYIHNTNVNDVSLERFINSSNILKQVVLRNCGYTDKFLRKHRDFVRKNNLLLDFDCQTFQVCSPYGPCKYDHWYSRREGTSRPTNFAIVQVHIG